MLEFLSDPQRKTISAGESELFLLDKFDSFPEKKKKNSRWSDKSHFQSASFYLTFHGK